MEVEKFDKWNERKKEIHFLDLGNKYPKVGEMWYVHIGINIGNESLGKGNDFKRPVLIIKKLGNMFFCISMTTKGKIESKFYYNLGNSYFS